MIAPILVYLLITDIARQFCPAGPPLGGLAEIRDYYVYNYVSPPLADYKMQVLLEADAICRELEGVIGVPYETLMGRMVWQLERWGCLPRREKRKENLAA